MRRRPPYKIITVVPGSKHLTQVIKLADRNSRTLGHFPKSCFEREAGKDRVLAAIGTDDSVRGYVLYRTTPARAVVQQLCVHEQHRLQGVARALCEELKSRTRHLPGILCHCAKEYEALEAWQRLGFVPMAEKAGRGRSGRPLIQLYLDHGHSHLFSENLKMRAEDTIVAVMDVNVAIDVQDQDPSDSEAAMLGAGWLEGEVSFWVTDEALSEVARQEDTQERKRRMAFIRGQASVPRNEANEKQVLEKLKELLGTPRRKQDQSDLRQLAQSIAGEADVFLTRDKGLLRYSEVISEQFGLTVYRPVELILSLDEIVRRREYAPARLHGTAIRIMRPGQAQLDALIDRFLNYGVGERKHRLADIVHRALADPSGYRVAVIESETGGQHALLVVKYETLDHARIVALRVMPGPLAETLTRHLLQETVRESLRLGYSLVTIEDRAPLHQVALSAALVGFVRDPLGTWVKWSMEGVHRRDRLSAEASALAKRQPNVESSLLRIGIELTTATGAEESIANLERLLWPGMLAESPLRTFVVPIQPRFAAHLFDAKLGGESLFGGDPSLLLNSENVYYRSGKIQVVSAPSRILWYVSTDKSAKIREVRACSAVLATHVGRAKDLFQRFQRLGVYEWEDILEVARGNPDNRVMAIHFGATECLPIAVPGEVLRPMIAAHRGADGPPPLSMPVEIPSSCFEEICEIAYANTAPSSTPHLGSSAIRTSGNRG